MLKLKDVYVQNPALGDPNSIDKQIEENGEKLDSLKKELFKFEVSQMVLSIYIRTTIFILHKCAPINTLNPLFLLMFL